MAPGLPAESKYASRAMPASSGMIRTILGGWADARRFTSSGDPWTRRSARRAETTCGQRNADHHQKNVDPMEREVTLSKRGPVNGTRYRSGRKTKKSPKPMTTTRYRRHHGLYGRDHRDLTWRGADKAHRGKALLAPCGRKPAGGGDQDQNRQQECNGYCRQNEL